MLALLLLPPVAAQRQSTLLPGHTDIWSDGGEVNATIMTFLPEDVVHFEVACNYRWEPCLFDPPRDQYGRYFSIRDVTFRGEWQIDSYTLEPLVPDELEITAQTLAVGLGAQYAVYLWGVSP
jgi:hypothetical protein